MLIFDGDPGIDDAIAIILLEKLSKDRERYILATYGNVSQDKTERNALIVLGVIGSETPVLKGEEKPIEGEIKYAEKIHGKDGLGGASQKYSKFARRDKTIYYRDFFKEKKEAEIICTGPITTTSYLIEILDVKRIIWMGGAIFTGGNTTQHAEFNAYCDPVALQKVISSKIPFTIVPLDATKKTLIRKKDFINIIKNEKIKEFVEDIINSSNIILHDPLAVAYYFFPEIFKTVKIKLTVDTKIFKGKTQGTIMPHGDITMVYDFDRKKFFEIFSTI